MNDEAGERPVADEPPGDGPGSAAESPVVAPAPVPEVPRPRPSASRPTAEFLVVLLLSVLLFRTFAAEAYIVPTGSMAPTLMGMHREVTCPDCRMRFAVGMDEQGRSGRAICPNCGAEGIDEGLSSERNGDRLLVQKYLFDWRPPRRWEVAVFQNPGDPSQAYVKRVVALPGESVLIDGGDVVIDGRVARKSLAEQRAMRILVYDHDFQPRDIARYPRWSCRVDRGGNRLASAWKPEGTAFVHQADRNEHGRVDWLEYRHWDPDRGGYGPVRDFTPYNGGEVRGENRVDDLMLAAHVRLDPESEGLALRLRSGSDTFVVTLANSESAAPVIRRLGPGRTERRITPVDPVVGPLAAARDRPVLVEASLMDRRLTVAIDGVPLFEPIDYDDPAPGQGPWPWLSPLALGAIGEGGAEVSGLRVYRDVYYTSALAGALRRPFGVEVPYRLGRGEYFVLGDNSPVSNDSRFWAVSPVVREELLLGKPFLVHLPSRGLPLKVFGHETYWVPDPREIRYIR
ncbi:MAG TPA: signal peptidase I [Isosphaeraceae bacterium]|jgi:signal peptidase I|nr:signal peptidase I [Isosphaeraceae bacterium]